MVDVPDEVRAFLSGIGREGGKAGGPARAKKLSAAQRKAIAKKASLAAAAKRTAKAKAKKEK